MGRQKKKEKIPSNPNVQLLYQPGSLKQRNFLVGWGRVRPVYVAVLPARCLFNIALANQSLNQILALPKAKPTVRAHTEQGLYLSDGTRESKS